MDNNLKETFKEISDECQSEENMLMRKDTETKANVKESKRKGFLKRNLSLF